MKKEIEEQGVEVFGTKEVSVKEFMGGTDKSLVLLSSPELAKENLVALHDKYETRVGELVLIDKLSPAELKELNSIRGELREPRYLVQKIEKNNTSVFEAYKKTDKANLKELIEINKSLEDKADEKIKIEEYRKKNEKAEAERLEREREANLRKSIDDFESDSYKIVQSTTISDIEANKTMLDALVNKEIDYEEFDILFEQAKNRIQNAWDLKCDDIQEKEEQRLENERMKQEIFNVRVIRFKEFGFELEDGIIFRSVQLPHTYTKDELLNIDSATFERAILNLREAKEEIEQSKIDSEANRISELQASRLTEILPYVAFGEPVDITKLSELSDNEYQSILLAKKFLFEADVISKNRIKEEQEAKAEEEKEAVYEIRKKRLQESGMEYSDEHDTLWLEEESEYILLKEDVSDCNALEFEETFSEVRKIIQDAKDKVENDKVFEIRKGRLAEIGVFYDEVNGFSNQFGNTNSEVVYKMDSNEFEACISDTKLAIKKSKSDAEEAEKQKYIDLKLAEDDAKRLRNENKARIKRLAKDKSVLKVSFEKVRDIVIEQFVFFKFDNEETEAFRKSVELKFGTLFEEFEIELEKL